jgi:hypothetical protein
MMKPDDDDVLCYSHANIYVYYLCGNEILGENSNKLFSKNIEGKMKFRCKSNGDDMTMGGGGLRDKMVYAVLQARGMMKI